MIILKLMCLTFLYERPSCVLGMCSNDDDDDDDDDDVWDVWDGNHWFLANRAEWLPPKLLSTVSVKESGSG